MPKDQPKTKPEESLPLAASTRYFHRKGYFTVWVDRITENDRGKWVVYWIEQNCDITHIGCRDAEHGDALVYRSFFESNHMLVAHEDRFRRQFTHVAIPTAKLQITHHDHFGNPIKTATPDV